MATSLFNKLNKELATAGIEARTAESRKWFTNRVRGIKRINEVNFLKLEINLAEIASIK